MKICKIEECKYAVHSLKLALREKRPNTDFFLVLVFQYSVRIQENAEHIKLRIWELFR